MLRSVWNTVRRWRTWIFNALASILLVLPEILSAFAGYDWSGVLPPGWMPYVTIAIIVVNLWMRPRPAVLPTDDEAKR